MEVMNLLKYCELEGVFNKKQKKTVTIIVQLQDGPQWGYPMALAEYLRTFEVRVVESL